VWLILIAVESLNGYLRGHFVLPFLGDQPARIVSFLVAIILIVTISTLTIGWVGGRGVTQLLGIWVLWALLTFCYEAFVIRPLLNISWEQLFADYDPLKGGLMAIGMTLLIFIPSIAFGLNALLRPYSDLTSPGEP
jgi:hypothetical protein